MNEECKKRLPLLVVGTMFLVSGIFFKAEWSIGYGFGLIVGYIL